MKYLIFSCLLLSGCAGSYTVINPSKLYFSTHNESNNIVSSCSESIFTEENNRRYYNKSQKNDIDFVSISITNNSINDISIEDDLVFVANDYVIHPLDLELALNQIKQPAGLYMLHSLWFLTIKKNNKSTYIPLGAVVGVINAVGAGEANKNMKTNLMAYNIKNKTLRPGQKGYYIIALNGTTRSNKVRVKVRE